MERRRGSQPNNKNRFIHGMARTSEYNTWFLMKQRCYNAKNKSYHQYGGRGIKVCKRWERFENFFIDMGKRPTGMTLDRKNNDLGYSKSNCRWATAKEQGNNTRKNIRILSCGQRLTITQWAEKNGIKPTTLFRRFHAGWTMEDILNPTLHRPHQISKTLKKKNAAPTT